MKSSLPSLPQWRPLWSYAGIYTRNSVLHLITHLSREELDIKEHFRVLFLLMGEEGKKEKENRQKYFTSSQTLFYFKSLWTWSFKTNFHLNTGILWQRNSSHTECPVARGRTAVFIKAGFWVKKGILPGLLFFPLALKQSSHFPIPCLAVWDSCS